MSQLARYRHGGTPAVRSTIRAKPTWRAMAKTAFVMRPRNHFKDYKQTFVGCTSLLTIVHAEPVKRGATGSGKLQSTVC
jgi:hypothetical protein